MTTIVDTLGRPIREGDSVGGTTSGRYQATIAGPVLRVGQDRVKVLVTNRAQHGGTRPANGDQTWIDPTRLFLTHTRAQRTFTGFSDPDGRVWTLAAGTSDLYEAPFVQARYTALELRTMYDAKLTPEWADHAPGRDVVCDAEGHAVPHTPGCPDNPAPQLSPAEIRAEAFTEGAARIWDLPQDYELDPGRGDARELLTRMAAEARTTYPPVLPWAPLMHDDDLRSFLADVWHAGNGLFSFATEGEPKAAREVLAEIERIAGTWRLVAEAQHAHDTADGPDHP